MRPVYKNKHTRVDLAILVEYRYASKKTINRTNSTISERGITEYLETIKRIRKKIKE